MLTSILRGATSQIVLHEQRVSDCWLVSFVVSFFLSFFLYFFLSFAFAFEEILFYAFNLQLKIVTWRIFMRVKDIRMSVSLDSQCAYILMLIGGPSDQRLLAASCQRAARAPMQLPLPPRETRSPELSSSSPTIDA